MSRKSTRRDFLSGKAVSDAAADRLKETAAEIAATPEEAGESYLLHVARRAMASQFQVFFNVGQYAQATEAALEALDLIEQLESQLSVFRPASEISRINALAADGPVEVEPRLFGLLQQALRLYEETGGAYDITSGPLWEAWGFARREGRLPPPEALAEARQSVGSHLLELDVERLTVRFRQPGVTLNLGSIGKGYALDRAAELLRSAEIDDFLFHGGQSSILACGSQITGGRPIDPNHPNDWAVGIHHPQRRSVRLAEVRLRNRALGTSGTENQFFRHQGRRYGHILDPRSGWPADQLFSATVIAPSAALADALSTAFFVMGVDTALQYCQTRPEIAAVLLAPVRGGKGFEIHTAGLKPGELRLTAE